MENNRVLNSLIHSLRLFDAPGTKLLALWNKKPIGYETWLARKCLLVSIFGDLGDLDQ